MEPLLGVIAEVAAHETAANLRVKLSERSQRLKTVQLGHAHVQQDDVDDLAVPPEQVDRFLTTGRNPDGETLLLHRDAQHAAHARFIINN